MYTPTNLAEVPGTSLPQRCSGAILPQEFTRNRQASFQMPRCRDLFCFFFSFFFGCVCWLIVSPVSPFFKKRRMYSQTENLPGVGDGSTQKKCQLGGDGWMGKRWFQWLVAMHQKTALQPEDTLKMRGLLAGDLVEGSMINLRLIGSMPARERERARERKDLTNHSSCWHGANWWYLLEWCQPQMNVNCQPLFGWLGRTPRPPPKKTSWSKMIKVDPPVSSLQIVKKYVWLGRLGGLCSWISVVQLFHSHCDD